MSCQPPYEQDNYLYVSQSGGSALLIAECSNKIYIIEKSDFIIEATVLDVVSRWNEDKSSIITYTSLSIDTYVKGNPFKQNMMQIITPGGTVDGLSQWVEDQPIFHKGKKVKIFMQEEDGEFSIICGNFGIVEI